MAAPKIVVPEVLGRNEQAARAFEEAGCEIVRVPAPGPGEAAGWTPELIEKYFGDADAFLGIFPGRPVTRAVLQGAPRLRVGASPVIGVDSIDVVAATDLGIAIGFGAAPENYLGVAEAVVMLTAALVKHMPQKWAAVRSGGWRVDNPGNMVMNHNIGLVGFGNIGQGVARRLQGWDVNLIAADPYFNKEIGDRLNVKQVDLDTLLQTSDVVSVMVVLNDDTRHMISDREFGLMKQGAYLINTSRGPAVDEAALIRALNSGRLGGVGLDVWEQEPTREDNPLRNHPLVISTGHNVGHSEEVYAALPGVATENILRGLRGEEPLYLRNPEVLPAWKERLSRLGVLQLATPPQT
jgi:phosphoglycerate dehydrogenase-like enzyme